MKLSSGALSFLGRLVDRLDAADKRGAERAQSVALSSKIWPELVEAHFESDKAALWEEAQLLHSQGWVRITPEIAARSPAGYAQDVRFTVLLPEEVRKSVGRPERLKSASERWREAVEEHLIATPLAKQVVGAFCIELPGRTMLEVVQRLNAMAALSGEPLLLREVSAKLFWGMSKVLDGRQGLVAAVLGLPECPFPETPVQLLVQLPAGNLRGVLFIENQMSFEQAARSGSPLLEGIALVFASGFKGSALRLRSPAGASVFYSHRGTLSADCREAFESWLFEYSLQVPTHFWGDLDWSGMGILRAMRATFPDITAWQPGYLPMLQSLVEGHGHAPIEAEKAGQIAVVSTGCAFSDSELIPALKATSRFVDQEMTVVPQ
ncbi:Wadjet anti-phage system protein JetD domain-containing protein [Acidovorax sp.]|uniref:Wadjet anti-phage system protein JetD domain-containing protein n=1 Tax=Acidovorax sp. TaxID=1872122 RepID=UPI0026044580|nr:Wadjet anti-phage system protein JetD domain-containing protein [Acidovorax sp.]